MNKIYIKISDQLHKFREQAYRFTADKNEVDEVVQETVLYFLQMNQKTLKKIYDTDGIKAVVSYGCIMIKRSLTCRNNQYYYKLNKYYTKINSIYNTSSTKSVNPDMSLDSFKYKSLDNLEDVIVIDDYVKLEKIDKELDNMYWYDREIFKLYFYEGNTLDSLAHKTKISRNSLFTTIKKVKMKLKEILNEY